MIYILFLLLLALIAIGLIPVAGSILENKSDRKDRGPWI